MSFVPVRVTYEKIGDGGGGANIIGRGLFFDTDSKTIYDRTESRPAAYLDPKPADVNSYAGTLLYFECDADLGCRSWVYGGGNVVNEAYEANSGMCGWTPPLTCDLGTANVAQSTVAGKVRLTVSYTGTSNGVAYYSLDGGAEQTSPLFNDVASGQHTLRLRDDGLAGCTREITTYVAPAVVAPPLPPAPSGPPAGLDFVNQPLYFPLTGLPAGALVDVELWAESAQGRGDFALVLGLRKQASALGAVSFRLDTLLRPLLSAFVPPAGAPSGQLTQVCQSQLTNYYVRTSVLAPAAGAVPTLGVSMLRTALRGGLPAEWQALDYFAERLAGTFGAPPFLSWQPAGPGGLAGGQAKAVVVGQPDWLFFVCEPGLAGEQLQVRRRYLPAVGVGVSEAEAVATPAGGWACRVLAIPLLTRAGYATQTVQVETASGRVVSQLASYRYVVATDRTRFVQFTNSLGGLDTLRCQGRLDVTLEASAASVDLVGLGVPTISQAPLADSQLSDLSAGRKLKLATGWLSPAELLWAQELILARELWQQVGEQLRPLDWPKRTLQPYGDEPGLRGLLLDFDYAYAPTAYAPDVYA